MDAAKILVIVLTLITLGFLVVIEINSRTNSKRLTESGCREESESSNLGS